MPTELLLTHFTKSSQFLFAKTPFHIYEISNGNLKCGFKVTSWSDQGLSRVSFTLNGLFLVVLCGQKVEFSEMEMENTPEPHNFVTIHDWDFSMGGRIQIDNSSDQESTISGSPTENITG